MMESSDLLLRDYKPVSKLEAPVTEISSPRFSVIDTHNHLGDTGDEGWINRPVSELTDVMGEADVDMIVDLDGGWGEEILNQHLDHFKIAEPGRFTLFCGMDPGQWRAHGNRFGEWEAKSQEVSRWASWCFTGARRPKL